MDKPRPEKRNLIDPLPETRCTFAQFCRLVWTMSARADYHYVDFCAAFDPELQTLYFKNGGGVK